MNIMLDAFYSLGQKINKRGGQDNIDTEQGVVSEKLPELKLEMSNEDLSKLTTAWQSIWDKSEVKATWMTRSEENEKYWLGNHFNKPEIDKTRPMMDNAIFEALETYLPRITRRNPEPMVSLAGEQEKEPEVGQAKEAYAKTIQKKLGDLADELKVRLRLEKAARHWAIYLLGAAKMGWDLDKDIPAVKIVRAKKLILDPESTVDEDGYTGKYIEEYRKMEAGQ